MKVLVIDDSPEALTVARARLRPERVEVVCADGGAAGLEAARAEQPDLILLDLDMPDMSGFEVLRALKRDNATVMVPVIFLTGSASLTDKVAGLDLGAVDYVTKPFDAFELRARVRAALRTKRLQDLLIQHAQIDPLTELANRRGLMGRLGQQWALARRSGGRLAFIMADLDHFKEINDAFGHSAGDRLLHAVARALAAECRESDTPARYGGEEFAILAPGAASADAGVLAERCRHAVERIRLSACAQQIHASASFGVADNASADTPESLIEQADAALYFAKRDGRNRVALAACSLRSPPPGKDAPATLQRPGGSA